MLIHRREEGDIAGTVGLSNGVHQDGDQQRNCSYPSDEDSFSSEYLEIGPGGVGTVAKVGDWIWGYSTALVIWTR